MKTMPYVKQQDVMFWFSWEPKVLFASFDFLGPSARILSLAMHEQYVT